MRALLLLWFVPLALFWGWYGLAANDINLGTLFFSRQMHDVVFGIYANATGIPAGDLPGIVAGACAFDSLIVAAIAAFRWRKNWYPQFKSMLNDYWNGSEQKFVSREAYATDPMHPAE